MRELKFRVWFENVKRGHKKGDEIVWNIESYYDYDPIIDNGGLLEVEGGWDIHGHSDENYTVEQYTGLKDKNGKEIYEGDIVVNTYYDDGEMYKVLWVDDSVAFGMESLDDMELYKLPLESLEVIGNIHENAELLG